MVEFFYLETLKIQVIKPAKIIPEILANFVFVGFKNQVLF